MKKDKLKSYLKWFSIGVGSVFLTMVLGFYVTIVSGWIPKTQELWVTTAMTTLSHKWLATSFIDEEVINDIMERNKVNDEGYQTDESLVVTKPNNDNGNEVIQTGETTPLIPLEEPIEKEPVDTYVEEGYTLLEEGIYTKDVSGTGWKGYLLLVSDPSRVDLVQTRYQYERGDLIKTLVPLHEARVGINAGGFVDGSNYDSNGGTPAGLLIVDGEVINSNGNSKHSVIGFNQDNKLILGKMTKQEAVDANLKCAVDFKPFLIVNGEPMMTGDQQGGWGIAPRTALGQRPTGEVIFLCVDGRQAHSIGCDLRPLQDTLMNEGCINAAMVDGGSSTVMYHTELGYLNKPSLGHERYINNCWIVK